MTNPLGAFPPLGSSFVLLVLKPTGQLDVRVQLPNGNDPRAVVAFLRTATEDIEREMLGVHILRPGEPTLGGE
jgi:hypothetical protein